MCTKVEDAELDKLNYDKGDCAADISTVTAKCNFACKEGYWHVKGDTNITFTCAHNGGVTEPEGIDNWKTLQKCQGA